jgi:hypothetical protein
MFSPPAIRKLLLRFDRAVKKNQDQRSKYPDDPTKCVRSTTRTSPPVTYKGADS